MTWNGGKVSVTVNQDRTVLKLLREADPEDEGELEDDYDWERKRLFEVRGRENPVIVGSLLFVRSRSRIVIVLELVLETWSDRAIAPNIDIILDYCPSRAQWL